MMRKKYVLINVFAIATALLTSCNPAQRADSSGQDDKIIRVSKSYPRYFETGQGETWIPVMINIIVPNQEESVVFGKLESYFSKFSENGGNAVRIWLSSPFLEIEDTRQGEYNPDKFRRIDKLIELARKYSIRLKFTLQHIRSISPDRDGRPSWSNKAILSDKNGGTFTGMHQYLHSPEGKENYLNRVKALSARYKDNLQIFSWELWNEMDAVDSDWIPFSKEMLDSVQRLFPNHLVVQTLGSMHSADADSRYEDLLKLEPNDYITVHRYLDPGTDWDQYDHVHGPIDLLISQAIQFVYREDVLKPIVPNEHGAVEANHAGPNKLYRKDSVGVFIHDMVFAPFFCGASGCGAMWHWDTYVHRQDLWYHYKRFATAIKGIDPVEEEFVPFTFEKDSVRVYGLNGKHTTLIWCRDAENNWITELQEGIRPEIRRDFIIDIGVFTKEKYSRARIYDPWENMWSTVSIDKNRVTLPPFVRSTVVVLQ